MLAGRSLYWKTAAAIIVLDQIAKAIVERTMPLHRDYPVIYGLLSLQYVRNTGAAFGILSNADLPYQGVWLSVVSLMALGAILVYALRLDTAHKLPQVALALVMGGAIGNLIDRARLGYVIDFVLLYWREYRWPNFNVADSAITIGIVLLVLDILRSPDSKHNKAELSETAPSRTE